MPVVPIPGARESAVTVAGQCFKPVECAHCGRRFFYLMRRQVRVARATVLFLKSFEELEAEARAEAQTALQAKLAAEQDVVPCLYCGRYQPEMAARIRAEWVRKAAWIALMTAVVMFFVWINLLERVPHLGAGMTAAGIAAVIFVLSYIKWGYDPDRRAAARIEPRRPGLLTPEELDLLLAPSPEPGDPEDAAEPPALGP